jgi:hypothetical protein
MAKAKTSDTERESELSKLDLIPRREGQKRADDLLRTLLSSPPDPQTPKPKSKQTRRPK